MQSRPVRIGFEKLYDQSLKPDIGFEKYENEYDNNVTSSYYSENTKRNSSLPYQVNKKSSSSDTSKSMPLSSSSSQFNKNSHSSIRYLFTPLLSTIYNEIITQWFKEKWLIFIDNHKETFLILDPDITGYLTVQMAINDNYFLNNKLPLLYQPECLLIRTKAYNKSLLLPNSTISLEKLFDKNNQSIQRLSYGKLIAIICTYESNSNLMFYKHSPKNSWYIFYNDPLKPHSNILTDEQQFQLESIIEQDNFTNFIHPSKLSFPLSVLCNHSIVYVYLL